MRKLKQAVYASTLASVVLFTSACASYGPGRLVNVNSVIGVSSPNIKVFLEDDTKTGYLHGHVESRIEAHLAEIHVRKKYDLDIVRNVIFVD